MITCIVLGTGIPTIPNYIITAAIAGPALLALGVPLIVSHMFVFYFGIFADLTPPVALACFAAAPIARESGLKISYDAMKIATAGFVVPFMAVYAPELMLQPGGPLTQAVGFPLAVAWIVGKAVLAIGLWGAAIVGYLAGPLPWPMRLAAAAAALLLVLALPVTDELGLALAAAVSASSGGAAAAPPRREPLHPRRQRGDGARRLRLHPRLGAFGRARRLGRALARRARRPPPRRGAGQGLGRRHGPRPRRPRRGRLVGLDPGRRAAARAGASPPPAPPAGGWRLCHRRRLPDARRRPRAADPAPALRAMMQASAFLPGGFRLSFRD